jgi:hypothetical protein
MRIALYADDGTIIYDFGLNPKTTNDEFNSRMRQLTLRMQMLVEFEKQRNEAEAEKNRILIPKPGATLDEAVKSATIIQLRDKK